MIHLPSNNQIYTILLILAGDPEYDEARRAGDARAEKKYRHMETTLNYSNKDTTRMNNHTSNETMGEGGESVVVYQSDNQNDGVEEMKQDMVGIKGSGFESVASISQPPQQLHQNVQQQLQPPQNQASQPSQQQQQQQQTRRSLPKPCHTTPKSPRAPTPPAIYKGPENNQALLKQMMVGHSPITWKHSINPLFDYS